MTKKKLNLIEGIGLILILLSFLIQLIESNIESEVREAQFYQSQVKLDKLWNLVGSDYKNDNSTNSNTRYLELQELDKNWQYYSQDKKYLDNWKNDVFYEGITNWRIWIFLLGSIMVVMPKFILKK